MDITRIDRPQGQTSWSGRLLAPTLAATLVLAAAAGAAAQDQAGGAGSARGVPPGAIAGVALRALANDEGSHDPAGARLDVVTAGFMSFGMSEDDEPGRTVTGAPYAAESVSTSTQTLADGNRIVHTQTTSIARDSQGRVRREMAVTAVGSWMPAPEEAPNWVTIEDPVSGHISTLDTRRKTAMRHPIGAGTMFISRMQDVKEMAGPTFEMAMPAGRVVGEAGAGASVDKGNPFAATTPAVTVAMPAMIAIRPGKDQERIEGLGTQTIEGVEAVGTRKTITIPAGEVGNEQPIQIVSERWYSSELQTTILAKLDDPRMGVVVTRLTNISRAEQPATLFEIPADYKVTSSIMHDKSSEKP